MPTHTKNDALLRLTQNTLTHTYINVIPLPTHTQNVLSTHLSFLVDPLHCGGGEEGEDETEGPDEVTRQMVDQRQLLKHHRWIVEAHQQNHCSERKAIINVV